MEYICYLILIKIENLMKIVFFYKIIIYTIYNIISYNYIFNKIYIEFNIMKKIYINKYI